MPEKIIDHRDFCQRLIDFLADCPCNNPNPTAVCPCYAMSSDSSSCLRRQRRARAARDVVAAVPQSTANPAIPAMNQHALVATISDLAEDLAVEVIGPFALLLMRVPAIEAIFIPSKADEGPARPSSNHLRPCGGPHRALRTARVPAIECDLHSIEG